MSTPTLKPGYAYEWLGWLGKEPYPRTQDWEIVVCGELDIERGEYRGTRYIDGAECRIFFISKTDTGLQRFLAQVAI